MFKIGPKGYRLKAIQKHLKYLIVGGGGSLGAVARYWVGGYFKTESGGFPLATFLINLTGSLVLAFFLTLILEKFRVADEWRWFFATGFLGAYTTFSSFTLEVINLFRGGNFAMGLLYSGASLVGGIMCAGLGWWLARRIIVALPPVNPQGFRGDG